MPFESQFWPTLTAFVILCGVQPLKWSSHMLIAKYCLFASFRCINHLFCGIICAQWPFVSGDFHQQCTADRPVATGAQNSLKVVLGDWSRNSKLLWACVWSCHPESCHLGDSPRQEYDMDDMTNIPKALLSWDMKACQGSGWPDQMHGSWYELPSRKHY